MSRILCAMALVTACTGCASVVNDSTHPMRVDTKTQAGEVVTGADCTLTNDGGVVTMKSGDTAQVRRSAEEMAITCKHPANPEGVGRAISRASAGMWGNILLGGGVGAIIDHSSGKAYGYPTWVELVFGKTLIFDRSDQKEGQPAPGTEAVVVK